jgi:hypothetical protein
LLPLIKSETVASREPRTCADGTKRKSFYLRDLSYDDHP